MEDSFENEKNADVQMDMHHADHIHKLRCESDGRSYMKMPSGEEEKVPLWLLTFTDVMALMLTFFVLMYSMSVPVEKEWEKLSTALTSKTNEYSFDPKSFRAGSQDVLRIDKISKSKALDLDYLETIISSLLKEKNIEGVLLVQNDKRLIVSLPSELLFESGKAQISLEGKKVLFDLGGVLARVKNRIEVIGHTDPRPIQGARGLYTTNWELSLARASSVAVILRDVGYVRNMMVRGLSSARYDELPESMEQQRRYDISRRVDIVVMDDDGYRTNLLDTSF